MVQFLRLYVIVVVSSADFYNSIRLHAVDSSEDHIFVVVVVAAEGLVGVYPAANMGKFRIWV